jgi:hypothetical protein
MCRLLHLLPLLAAVALGGCTGQSAAESTPAAQASVETRPAESIGAKSPAADTPKSESPANAPAKGVTFDDIKLDLKKGDPFTPAILTPKVKQLDGKAITIRGYILPSFQQTGIKQFVLVRDNMECCFGPGALLHDCILVEMAGPATATFTVRPVSVEGTFTIHELLGPDGKHLAIYHLDGKEVK